MRPSIDLAAVARDHLPPTMAETWIGLLRPGIQLDTDEDSPGSVVGHLGGEPQLPADEPWPQWPGHGLLTFVATINCTALPPGVHDLALPGDGTLLFFYFDGQLDDGDALVIFDDPASQAGARVLHVPSGTETKPRTAPDGITPYAKIPLHASVVDTAPSYDDFVIRDAFPSTVELRSEHPVRSDAFVDALDAGSYVGHQLGGHASPIQGPVEAEVAHVALCRVNWLSPDLAAEATNWRLLAQIDSDDRAGMTWGDGGMLYWMIKEEDLVERRFDRALFTWQCS